MVEKKILNNPLFFSSFFCLLLFFEVGNTFSHLLRMLSYARSTSNTFYFCSLTSFKATCRTSCFFFRFLHLAKLVHPFTDKLVLILDVFLDIFRYHPLHPLLQMRFGVFKLFTRLNIAETKNNCQRQVCCCQDLLRYIKIIIEEHYLYPY